MRRAPARPAALRSGDLLAEAGAFVAKQASACVFGILLLLLIAGTAAVWPADAALARYDFLLFAALAIQAILIATGLESWGEARVILVFHIVGTVMEIFKTHVGAWVYPEESLFRIAGVPLFTGFMYSSVGSYIARSMRLCDMRFTGYPAMIWTVLLSIAVYANFFAHHFGPDLRYVLFAVAGILWWRTRVHFAPGIRRVRLPLLAIFGGIAVLIWIAENISTYSGIWLYPNQMTAWQPVSPAKIGSWFLLMLISWVLVTVVSPPRSEHDRV